MDGYLYERFIIVGPREINMFVKNWVALLGLIKCIFYYLKFDEKGLMELEEY